MKTRNILLKQCGFTLIETLIAMAIFTIGILGLFGMQTAAIKENLVANDITTGTTLATDQIEQLISSENEVFLRGELLKDEDNDGCSGLDHDTPETSDYPPVITLTQPSYIIYANVARNCIFSETVDHSVKHVRIIVYRDNGSGLREGGRVSVINYIKNTRY